MHFLNLIFLHTFLLNFVNICDSQSFFSKAKLHPKCKQIEPTTNLDMNWAMSMFAGKRFFITLGSRSYYEDLSEYLTGKKETKDAELDKMCAEVRIKAFKVTFEGYDGRYLVLDCSMIKKGMQECKANARTEFPKRHKSAEGTQTLAWTDNKSMIVLVRCGHNGKKNDWLLYSSNTTLGKDTKDAVLKEMKTLGFPMDNQEIDFRTPKYDSCKIFPDDEK